MSKSETAGEEFEIFVQDRDAYLQHIECFCRAVRGEDVALEGLERIISLGRLLALLHHIVQHLSTYTHHNTHTPHHNTHTHHSTALWIMCSTTWPAVVGYETEC